MTQPVKPIPAGYRAVTPYLLVPGISRLLEFLVAAFDAQVTRRMERPDGTVGHAEVEIDGCKVMMGEATAAWPAKPGGIYLYVPEVDATYERAIAAGATPIMPPMDMHYGDRSGGVTDPSGNQWWIATRFEDLSEEELLRRDAARSTNA